MISLENPVYQVWKVIIVLMCLSSSLLYAYLAAFGIPGGDSITIKITLGFEVMFFFDLVVQFLLEYKPEDSYTTERNLSKIAWRYLKGRFLLDFLQVLPIELFYDFGYNNLFYIVKVLRLEQGSALLSTSSFMKIVKILFHKRLESVVSDSKLANNNELDNNNISK